MYTWLQKAASCLWLSDCDSWSTETYSQTNCTVNPLTLTVVILVQLQSILFQTGLSRHL